MTVHWYVWSAIVLANNWFWEPGLTINYISALFVSGNWPDIMYARKDHNSWNHARLRCPRFVSAGRASWFCYRLRYHCSRRQTGCAKATAITRSTSLSEESINGNSFTSARLLCMQLRARLEHSDWLWNAPKYFRSCVNALSCNRKKHQSTQAPGATTGLVAIQPINISWKWLSTRQKHGMHRISATLSSWRLLEARALNDGHDTTVTYSSFVNGDFLFHKCSLRSSSRGNAMFFRI